MPFESMGGTVRPRSPRATGAWREARLPARVGLKAGRNLLRMTSLGGGGLNLDEIRLTPAPPPAP